MKHDHTELSGRIIVLLMMACLSSACRAQDVKEIRTPVEKLTPTQRTDISPTTLIVSYDGKKAKKRLLKTIRKMKAEVVYDYRMMSGMAIRKSESMSLEETKARLERIKGVVNVSYDHIMQLHADQNIVK